MQIVMTLEPMTTAAGKRAFSLVNPAHSSNGVPMNQWKDASPRSDCGDDDKKNDANKGGIQMLMEKRFLEERKIFLWGEVNDDSMKTVMEKMLYLEADQPGEEIKFYLNTPGGSITAGMAVYDTMQMISSPIACIVTGMAASMGSILLSGATKGRRFIYPHARVLIHQPLIMGRIVAPAVDINIQAEEMEKLREELNRILAEASGQPIEKIRQDTDRDFYLNAQESIEYGLADEVVEKI